MKSIKRILAIVCAVTAMTTAVASAEMIFAGYDTTTPGDYGKLYYEVINGEYTSKLLREPVADEDVEWKLAGYELLWPHAGYEILHLEGNEQTRVTRTTNLFPQWETRFQDFMWELYGNHRIWQRQQTKIDNAVWVWDFAKEGYSEDSIFTPTTRYADVEEEFRSYGIANLDNNGYYVYDINGKVYNEEKWANYVRFDMPAPFNVERDPITGAPTKEIVAGDFFYKDNLSARDENGEYVVSDEDILKALDLPVSKFLTGPTYYGEEATKDVAAIYYANKDFGWNWDYDTVKVDHIGLIGWTAPEYQMAEPYDYYQYLIVNGVVMDGRADTPRIFRYTGGKASPDVEWKYAFAEKDEELPWGTKKFNVVEEKWIRDNDGEMIPTGEFRKPTGVYANAYIVVTDTDVEIWIEDDVKKYLIYSVNRTEADFGDFYAGWTNGAAWASIF